MKWVWLAISIVASAAMFELALPPVGWSVLGWVCFVPTLVACRGRGFAVGFGAGVGAVVLAAQFARLGFGMLPSIPDGDPGWIYAGFAVFGLPVGLLHGLVGEATVSRLNIVALTALAVLFEALLLLYLPGHIALTQSRSAALVTLASLTGVWGASAVVWAVQTSLTQLMHDRRFLLASGVAGAGMLISLPWPPAQTSEEGIPVVAVQSHIDDSDFLTAAVSQCMPGSIVVWPECAGLGFAVAGNAGLIDDIATRAGLFLATSYDTPTTGLPYNTMALFGEGSEVTYHKRKLFGGERSGRRPGAEPAVTEKAGVRFGMNICFDSCFPSVMRDTARLGADVILLPTLDPISNNGVCQAIHAAYTPFRASELGTAIVRADATAYSHVVDEWGRVLIEAGSGTQESVSTRIGTGARNTPYKMFGDWFLVLCGMAVLQSSFHHWRRLKKRPDETGRPR